MKKVILLSLFAAISCLAFGQRFHVLDSCPVPAGTDTTIYRGMWSGQPWSITVDYRLFDDVDAVFDLGVTPHPDSSFFDRITVDSIPYTMAYSTATFEKSTYGSKWLAIKLTKNSVTAGVMLYYWISTNNRIIYP